jgi:PAS domain S-box-containing protein
MPLRDIDTSEPSGSHSILFYEDESALLDNLSDFAGASLGAGGSFVVIATRKHREQLAECLRTRGVDVDFAVTRDRYIEMDAEETLDRFLVEGWPESELFFDAIEPEVQRAKLSSLRKSGTIAGFAEMVDLLWRKDRNDAAIEVERLCAELAERNSVTLRCAYPIGSFKNESQLESFRKVCAEHGHVFPAESYTSLNNEDDRLRMVSSLQQRASVVHWAVLERQRETAQRQEAETRLRRAEQFAKQVVESSIDCVNVLGLDGRVEYVSPPGARALEIHGAGQVGEHWVDLWNDEDRGRAEAAVTDARTGRIGTFQGDCRTHDGDLKSWDVRISPVRGTNGEVERLVAISRDVTELKNAQHMAVQAEKVASAGRMAATIAHEINNPLEAVTNLIYLAKTTPGVPNEVCRHLEIADRELARVAQIAKQTLGFYRDTSTRRRLDVEELVEDVLVVYERKLRSKRITTSISIEPRIKIYGKQGELKQVLSNLIANAIDASTPGGKIWLRVHGTKDKTNGLERGARITVADNGSGMSPEVKRRIFVPFFTTKSNVGTGIGLWVTKCLIEQQGGYLRFRSQQGQRAGTVMSFFVPSGSEGPTDEAIQANDR